jgi:hypothetical protein
MAGFENDVMVAKNLNFDSSSVPPHLGIITAAGMLPIGTGNLDPIPEILGGSLTSPDNSITFGYSSPDITAIVNTAVIQDLHITPYIVSPGGLSDGASFTTIQSALNAANSDGGGIVYVQPGSYTESLTLFADTEVVGTPGNSDAGTAGNTVIITGVHTPPATGSFTFANVRLVSATHVFSSAVAGSASLIIENSFIQITNGFLFNLANWTGTFVTYNIGEGSTNNGMVNNTGGATCFFISATHGAGTGQTMVTTGPVIMEEVVLDCPWSAQTGTTIACDYVIFNATVTAANNSTGTFNWCRFSPGAVAALTMSSSASINIHNSIINSSANPSIAGAGAGTLTLGDVTYLDNSAFATTIVLASKGTFARTPIYRDEAATFTARINSGSFITAGGNIILNLPATAADGDLVEVACTTANLVAVDAPVNNFIRIGTLITSGGGTATSTQIGDSLSLRYRLADLTWYATSVIGTWVMA